MPAPEVPPFQMVVQTGAWEGPSVALLSPGLRAESGQVEVVSVDLSYAKAILFVLDITAVSGIEPTLDVAIYPKLGDWFIRLLQFTQKNGLFSGARLIRRDGASFTDALTLLTDLPTPSASASYVKDGIPWGATFGVSYLIGGTFAPGDPGPPPVAAEGFTFSVQAVPLHF